jgi:YD repeat-containing protein
VTDLNGITTSAEYDTFGRMIKLIKPNDSSALPTVLATYYDTERPFRYRVDQREVAGQSGVRTSAQFYDGLGRTIQTKAESDDGVHALVSVVSDTRYDGLDRVVAQSQPRYLSESSTNYSYTAPGTPLFNQTATTYDALGRPLTISAPGSRTTTHSYGVELVNSVPRSYDELSDPLSHRTRSRYDALGRRTQVIEYAATNATTSYGYDSLDQLKTVTDATGNVTSLQYDSLGRKSNILNPSMPAMRDPDMGDWNYSYDVNGNLTSQTDAKSQTISFTYDNLNRLTSKNMPGGWVSYYAYGVCQVVCVNGRPPAVTLGAGLQSGSPTDCGCAPSSALGRSIYG